MAWAQQRHQPGRPAPWLRLDWHLGRDIPVQVRGQSFYWQDQSYFLVHSLVPAADWFCYSAVVCHMLGRASNNERPIFPCPTPVVPVATQLFFASRVALREQVAVEEATAPIIRRPGQQSAPPVIRAGCWALAGSQISTAACYPTTESIRPYLWEGCIPYLSPAHNPSPASLADHLPGLAQVIACLVPHLQAVRPLEVHNPTQAYGHGVSVFPPDSFPSQQTHLLSRHLRPIGLVQLLQGGAHYYLVCITDNQPALLLYEHRLSALSVAELEELLYQLSYRQHLSARIAGTTFCTSGKVYQIEKCPETEPPQISTWCLQQIRWGICLYNAYRCLLRCPDVVAITLAERGQQANLLNTAARYLERGYLHFPGREVGELPDVAHF